MSLEVVPNLKEILINSTIQKVVSPKYWTTFG